MTSFLTIIHHGHRKNHGHELSKNLDCRVPCNSPGLTLHPVGTLRRAPVSLLHEGRSSALASSCDFAVSGSQGLQRSLTGEKQDLAVSRNKSKNHWTTINHVKNAEENRTEQTVKTASKFQNLRR